LKVLITGKRGQLARALAEQSTTTTNLTTHFIGRPEFDLADPGSIARAIALARPDLVINAAAYTAVDQAEYEPELAFRINAEAAGEAASAARAAGAAIIQISTDYVFDGSAVGAYREDAPTNPLNVYGRSKLEGEEQVRAAHSNHLIIRTSWVYSPFGRNFVTTILRLAREREEVAVVANQIGTPTSALDLARAIFAIVEKWREGKQIGFGELYHVAGAGETSWYGLAQEVMNRRKILGLLAAKVVAIKNSDWPTPASRPHNSVLDSGKFARDFGIRLPDWRSSIAEVVARLTQEPR